MCVLTGVCTGVVRMQHIKFTDTTNADTQADKRKTSVLIKPDATGDLAIFTQHLLSELMAGHLVDVESGAFVFPASATIFDGEAKPEVEVKTTSAVTTSAVSCVRR